jgi:histidine triad (HIT) family protein
MDCVFCSIAKGETAAVAVFEDDVTIGFLDHRPLFPGHTLLIPKEHHETLADLPAELIQPFFANAQLLSLAIRDAVDAKGTFVAMNNVVSQSVPHFHVHVVPRRPKDGLRGFFWPRGRYEDESHMEEVAEKIRAEVAAKGDP